MKDPNIGIADYQVLHFCKNNKDIDNDNNNNSINHDNENNKIVINYDNNNDSRC